jgi:Methionyl-tRNA formyltransferase|tara:strand:- start:3835 stop:4503 length:669 start_codon:yes stop_codon:yes gene_type:complete
MNFKKLINICILFDKNNEINKKFFNKKKFLKQVKNKQVKIYFNDKINISRKFDLVFLVGFVSKIKLKSKTKYFTVHESDLPKGKGHSPIKHQLLKNKKNIVCCLIKLNNKIDSGNIIFKNYLKINSTDLFDDIKRKQMDITQKLFAKLINVYPDYPETKQAGKESYFPKLTDKDDKIDIKKSLLGQFNKIRSTNHYKYKNYFIFNKKKFFIRITNESSKNKN